MKKIDLHIHSSYSSDGEYEPEELVKLASEKELEAIAITDHNLMDGIDEATAAGKKYGIEIVPGIEIDTNFKDYNIHILGYYLNKGEKKLFQLLKDMRNNFYKLARARIERLNQLGFDITYEETIDFARDLPIGVVLAEVILSNGRNNSNPAVQPYLPGGSKSDQPCFNFHLDYFCGDGPINIKADYPSADKVVSVIKEAGGLPVLAHPGYSLDPDQQKDMEIIEKLNQAGLIGLEAYSTYHNKAEVQKFVDMANDYNLLLTAGSDFHGSLKPSIKLGGVEGNDYQLLIKMKKYYA